MSAEFFAKFAEEIENLRYPALEDGPHWTPDGGYFWAKGGKYYWPNGDVTTVQPARLWDQGGNLHAVEDYSAWSDEKRAAIWKETQLKRLRIKRDQARYARKLAKAVAIAEAKLTEEDIEALRDHYRDDY